MYLIKKCPSCNTKLRFPIDRGKIQVRCSCGYQFIANPDNSKLYNDAKFDLSYDIRRGQKRQDSIDIKKFFYNLRLNELFPKIIERLLNFKYKLIDDSFYNLAENRLLTQPEIEEAGLVKR